MNNSSCGCAQAYAGFKQWRRFTHRGGSRNFSKGPSPQVWRTEVPQWGSGVKSQWGSEEAEAKCENSVQLLTLSCRN